MKQKTSEALERMMLRRERRQQAYQIVEDLALNGGTGEIWQRAKKWIDDWGNLPVSNHKRGKNQ